MFAENCWDAGIRDLLILVQQDDLPPALLFSAVDVLSPNVPVVDQVERSPPRL